MPEDARRRDFIGSVAEVYRLFAVRARLRRWDTLGLGLPHGVGLVPVRDELEK